MRNRFRGLTIVIATAAVVAVLSLAGGPTAGQAPVSQSPRRADGKPDLSGIWQANNTANWDLQTHTARPMVAQPGVYKDVPVLAAPVVALGSVGWVPAGRGVVEGDEIPYLPAAAAKCGAVSLRAWGCARDARTSSSATMATRFFWS